MKLKSGCILWPDIHKGSEQSFPKLERDINCEVAIIGGGISGALVAYHLIQQGIHTVMVDRRHVGHGSTAASTGLLQYEIDTSLVELIEKIGKDRAIAAYRASVESLLAFEPLVAELGDSCGLVARPSLYLASREKDVDELRAECEARRSMKIGVEFIEKEKLREEFNLSCPAALLSRRAFEVDPFRLTLRLIRRATEMGLEVFNETEIAGMTAESEGTILNTVSGARIAAKKIVFAMGYETMQQIPSDLCRLTSTYALASQPLSDFSQWPQRCLIWESARPYLYLRTTEDNRVIVGGADEEIVNAHERDALLENKTHYLQARFSRMFPNISIDSNYAWAGTFAQTKDGLPYIGTCQGLPHCYFALGYGGNGITFSLLAAQILRNMFIGRQNAKIQLFRFDR